MERASSPGSFHLFRLFGVDVFLHWTWIIVAVFMVQRKAEMYDHIFYPIANYLILFGIVLLHEFGHALACRSVGGRANHIILWPLGGIALVEPPQRPGPVLWSIAAGPLVNLVLVPILAVLYFVVIGDTPGHAWTDLQSLVFYVNATNLVLLVFNMLPVYPLDGGQILQAILWFFLKRSTSLRIAAGFGLLVVVLAAIPLVMTGDLMLIVLALFIGMQAWQGLMLARQLAHIERAEAERAPWKM